MKDSSKATAALLRFETPDQARAYLTDLCRAALVELVSIAMSADSDINAAIDNAAADMAAGFFEGIVNGIETDMALEQSEAAARAGGLQ